MIILIMIILNFTIVSTTKMAGILSYDFVLHALEAALLASITCGFIGAYIVARRMVFISG